MKLTPEHELAAEARHPTAAEWTELTAALTAMGQLLAEQTVLLEERNARSRSGMTQEQAAELLRELREVRRLMEAKEKQKRPRISLPAVRLPRPSLEWLLVPTILLGLAVLWYGWTAFWSGLGMFV